MKRFHYIWLLFNMLAISASSQNAVLDKTVSVQFNQITLKQALANISTQYGIRFSYSDSNIPVDRIIEAEFSKVSLRSVLQQLLRQNEINFSIIDDQIVLFPFNIDQTITVKGKVIDYSSGEPVPYANIAISGTSKGTSSNQDGEFELNVSKLPSELIVSHLNHEKKLIHVYDEDRMLEIALIQAPRKLEEVTIKGRKSKNVYYNHLRKAYNRLSKVNDNSKYGKAFYRQKSSRETKFTEIFELFYDIRYTENGIEDWAVQEGRYAFQTEEEYDIFLYNKNFTLLSRMFPISQPATNSYLIPIHPDVKKHFEINLKDVLNYDDRLIGVISYKPRNIIDIPAPEGELYIDLENHQVLKMKGTFHNEDLDIVGFTDVNSKWENYQLDFQISFIDDPSDELIMDFIRIDHQFDYFFKDEFVGHINTSSLLSFYEHYSPIRNKRLGGKINYEESDMEVIDAVGYDPDFWSANPIVKRTPLEEKLIRDFEENEAFGVVFLNNEEEVVLLSDAVQTDKAASLIAAFEKQHTIENDHLLYVQLDKSQYDPGEAIQFNAFVVDQLTRKPFIIGSVLQIELLDRSQNVVINKSFDITQGSAYGEIELEEDMNPGLYTLRASTNVSDKKPFKLMLPIGISKMAFSTLDAPTSTTEDGEINVEFWMESNLALEGIDTKYVVKVSANNGSGVEGTWQITDQQGKPIAATATNKLGIGVFELAQYPGNQYFLHNAFDSHAQKWAIPQSQKSGFSLHIDKDINRSIRVTLHQKPAIPKSISLLFTANGKVIRYFEKQMNVYQSTIELPRQHLPSGIITLFALDQSGNELGWRTFYIPPEELNIRLESATWKSKRSNRAQLEFRITDQNNLPVKARLSAICSMDQPPVSHEIDIRNQLYFSGIEAVNSIDMNLANDSIYNLIDALLITNDAFDQDDTPAVNSGSVTKDTDKLAQLTQIEEPIIAEVSISGNYSPGKQVQRNRDIKKMSKNQSINENYWIPQIEINEAGMASFNYKIPKKSKPFYVQIQGIAQNGLVGYDLFIVDPLDIKRSGCCK